MKGFMKENDLIVAEIKGINYSEKQISLHIRNEKFGKLGKGLLVEVNNCLIPKMKTHFIDFAGVSFIFGTNGYIWLQSAAGGEATAECLENIAKFRNLIMILNESFFIVHPDMLSELHKKLTGYRARDLIVPENRKAVLEIIKTAMINHASK